MRITVNLNGVECDGQFVSVGPAPEATAVTVKIQEVGGRAAKIRLAWSDALDTWDVQVRTVYRSVPLLPVALPPKPWGEEIVIEVDAARDASVKIFRRPSTAQARQLFDVPAPRAGFLGKRGRLLGEAEDGLHVVRLAEYTFPDGTITPYAELHETHSGQYPGRVLALSTLVHLAQNVGENEVWEIGNREGPPQEPEGVTALFRGLVAEALARPGAPTKAALCRDIAPAWGVNQRDAAATLSRWLAGQQRTIPLHALEALLTRLRVKITIP